MKEVLFLCTLALTGCFMPISSDHNSRDRDLELVNITLHKTAEKIRKTYHLDPSGSGASMPGGPIRKLNLAFDARGPYTKERLRELLIKCSDELIKQVNSNEEMQQFLLKPPFSIDNVQIIIYNHDRTGREVYDPEISTADVSQGVFTYRTSDPKTSRFNNIYRETHEEALKALAEGSGSSK